MKFKIVIQKSVITAGVLTALTFNASAQASNEPHIRGNYYVCPNGKTLPTRLWRTYGYSPMSNRDVWKRIVNIRGEIIVGKSPDSYPANELERLMKKIMKGINVPTSYKLIKTKPDFDVRYGNTGGNYYMRYHTYEFANSEGKKLALTMDRGFDAVIKDNNGKILKTDSFFGMREGLSSMKCSEDSIIVRQVADFKLDKITNQYGESVRLPLMFMIREVSLKTSAPSSQNEYSF